MIDLMFVRSHVERCLQDAWQTCHVIADGDGDYPFRSGTAACYVRIEDVPPGLVRVFAIAATGLKPSAKLLAEINELNGHSRSARVVLVGGQLTVSQTLLSAACSPAALSQACESVSTVANDVGMMIATVFGGTTPFSAEEEVNTGELDY